MTVCCSPIRILTGRHLSDRAHEFDDPRTVVRTCGVRPAVDAFTPFTRERY